MNQNRKPRYSGPRKPTTRYGRVAPPKTSDAFDGVLLVDKPAGPTSHDIVAQIRKQFAIKKVGHGGTLDPRATGLLIILLGKGTKLSDKFMGSDKTYLGSIRLGVATDSQDADGEVVSEGDYSNVTREMLESSMSDLTGDIYQTPPMVSAVKINGVPLYKQARKGLVVERKPRLIHVYEFRLLDWQIPSASFLVRCTKGTYVRTLCSDIGDALGCGAHLASLCRTQSGDLKIENAISMADITRMDRDTLATNVIPIHKFSLCR